MMNLVAFVTMINVVLWVVADSLRIEALSGLFERGENNRQTLVTGLSLLVAALFTASGLCVFLANRLCNYSALKMASLWLREYLWMRFEAVNLEEFDEERRREYFRRETGRAEDRVFNAALATSEAFLSMFSSVSVAFAAFAVGAFLEPISIAVLLVLSSVFGAVYIGVSYHFARDKLDLGERRRRFMRSRRQSSEEAFAVLDPGSDLRGFLDDYVSVYPGEARQYFTARKHHKANEQLWRQLFVSMSALIVLAVIYVRQEQIQLSVIMVTGLVFSFRLGMVNLMNGFTHLSKINLHYPVLIDSILAAREPSRGIE